MSNHWIAAVWLSLMFLPGPAVPGAETGGGWVKYSGNPVLGGKLGTCFDVALLKEGDVYRMWFSWRPKASIALVESRDGIHWSEPLIVLGPNKATDWEANINRPCVLHRGGTYHMWYTGQARGHSWIGYATSADGKAWKRMSDKPVLASVEPWEKVAVMAPDVMWDEKQGIYRMWYSAGGQYEPDAIGYATSPDGLHWSKHPANPVMRPDPKCEWEKHLVTGAHVLKEGDGYVMFYIGFRDIKHAQIGLARSKDGITGWQRHRANPIIRPGEDKWDADACYKPFAIFDGRKWLLWYNGRHGGFEQIGLVTHEGEDLGFELPGGASVAAPAARRLVVDAQRGTWSLYAGEKAVISAAAVEAVLPAPATGSKAPQVVSLGPAECSMAEVQDKLGRARRTTLRRTIAPGLRLEARLTLIETEPVLAIDLSVTNTTNRTLELSELRPGGGFRLDMAADRCTAISNDYWFGPRPIVRLDEQQETTDWWSTAVVDRTTGQTVVLGIGEAANAGVTYRLHREGPSLVGDMRAGLSPSRGGDPLKLPGGSTFSLCRLLVVSAEEVHAGLERYADLLARNADVKIRHRAYSGLFTGYSSSPELSTVVRLDEQRVMKLAGLLKEKVGRYGIDFIKIEFEPCGSPNLLDRSHYRMEEYFPKGPRALADAIRGLGFRPALQSRTFTYVRGGDPREREKTAEIYRRFTRDWGFEYLMLDFNDTDIRNDDPTRPLMQVFRDRFRMIREAVGPEVFIEACMIPYGPVIGAADGLRPSFDFRGGREDSLLYNFATRYYLHGRIFQLDSEFQDIAQRPFMWHARNLVTPLAGMRAWVSLCGLTGYSYLFGGAMEETSDERFALASRALPVSGVAARPIDLAERSLPQVWSLEVSRGTPLRRTVGLFNWDYEGTKVVGADLARCGLPAGKTYAAFDFWQQRFLGEVEDQVEAALPARNAQVVWLTEITSRPEIIGGSRHLSGFLNGEIVDWQPAALRLTGKACGHGDDRVKLFVYIPQRRPVRSCEGASFEQVDERVVRLDVPTPKGESTWVLTLDPAAKVR
jgi:predicted GH43/DUF377 family glycosyl hydrolase